MSTENDLGIQLKMELNQGEDGTRRAFEELVSIIGKIPFLRGTLLDVTPSSTAQLQRHNLGRKPIGAVILGVVDTDASTLTNAITPISIIDDGTTDKTFVKLRFRGGDATVTSCLVWVF